MARATATTTGQSRRAGKRVAPVLPQQKTAVVVIHGMGEQRPLETLREFVETVYRRDPTLASLPTGPNGMLDVSIVPDDTTGSAELRRITTLQDGPQKRTDFFEFYWADIMDGTPLDMVVGWIKTLLLRSPWRLPRAQKVVWAWLVLWLLVALIVLAGVIAAHPNPEEIGALGPVLWIGSWLQPIRFDIAGVLIAGAGVLLAARIVQARGVMRSVALGLPVALLVAGLVLWLLPESLAGSVGFWAGALTALMGWAMNAVVTPYAGDVVRYTRATPSTVERRRLVRERGLALLEALHNRRLNDPTRAEKDNPPLYNRIVIVGHSLGSIVGYDILQLFWEKHGPTHHQDWDPNAPGMQEALAACDVHVQAAWGNSGVAFDADGFEAARAALFALLRDNRPGWRISDFITLGSPLTHAEFLLVDTPEAVKQAFAERRFATSPPRPDPLQRGSMLFSVSAPPPLSPPPDAERKKATPLLFPHFAAQFAAVKWTNLYDESRNPFLGDIVSGKLGDSFGQGIDEHDVTIKRPNWPGVLKRVFTHTQYWAWHKRYESDAGDIAARPDGGVDDANGEASHQVPEHIRLLRLALRLGE